jgi:hypothetical protein
MLKITSSSADVFDLRRSYKSKRRSARILYDKRQHLDCIYLGGYAFEILLKVYITRKLGLSEMPNCFMTHHLESLVYVAGLQDAKSGDATLNANFTFVNSSWNERIRYEDPKKYGEATAKRFMDALLRGQKGLIPWLEAKEKKL